METLFTKLENRLYRNISLIAFLWTLIFIIAQSKNSFLSSLKTNNDLFYLGFIILSILTIGSIAYFSPHFSFEKQLAKILFIGLPSMLVILFAINTSIPLHYIFHIIFGVYILLSGFLLTFLFIRKESSIPKNIQKQPHSLSYKQWFIDQGLPILLLLLLTTSMFFLFGLSRLTQYAAVDEPLWIDGRIARYWKNIGELDWKGTNISDKPGITVALVTGPGTLFKSTSEYKTLHTEGEIINLKNDVESYYFAFRFPILLFVTLMLPLFYFFLERLLGKRRALFSFIFIALSPVLIGMTKIVNPDSLLWFFSPLSLLSYFVFLKRGAFRYLIFSGIFLGLALLTKYVANILFVFFLGLILLEYIYNAKNTLISFPLYLKKSLGYFAVLTFSALSTFYILFPAVWVKPEKLLSSTLLSQAFEKVAPLFLFLIVFILTDQWINKSRLTNTFIQFLIKIKYKLSLFIVGIFLFSLLATIWNTWSGMTFYSFMELLASPKTIAGKVDIIGTYLTNFYPMIFGVTPFVFLLLCIAPFCFFKKQWMTSTSLRTTFYLFIFIVLYYIATTVNHVAAVVRYQIILFPLVAIIAGIALEHFLEFLHKKNTLKEKPSILSIASILLFFGILTLFTTPFPLSYASSFLPNKYSTDMKDMGAGSYETAQYLNTLPHAEDLLIWTDKDGVCKFFVGRCMGSLNYDRLHSEGLDYIVVSSGRQSRTGKMISSDITNNKPGLIRFDQYYLKKNPVFEIDINGRPSHFVKVFKYKE